MEHTLELALLSRKAFPDLMRAVLCTAKAAKAAAIPSAGTVSTPLTGVDVQETPKG